jgi:hypothetical protein
LLSTFPLAVFYRDLPDEAVVVMVFPLRKDPGVLKQRLATSSTK